MVVLHYCLNRDTVVCMVRNSEFPDIGDTATEMAQIIKEMVTDRGITQEALQRAIGKKARSYVSYRLNGKRAWTLDELDAIAPLLGYRNGLKLISEMIARK